MAATNWSSPFKLMAMIPPDLFVSYCVSSVFFHHSALSGEHEILRSLVVGDIKYLSDFFSGLEG